MLNRFEVVDVVDISKKAIEGSADLMADLNAEQINTGLKADGSEMPDYSLRSVIQYNKPAGPIRLRDKGNWQKGIYVKSDGETVKYLNTDSKDQMLKERYGEDIQGLSEKFKDEAIREGVQPEFSRLIEAATGLKMK
jgi:hypothetical protein